MKNSSLKGKGNISEEKGQRLQVFLAHAGVASRRAAEGIIAAGRVAVNGVTVSGMGSKVFSDDTVTLDGRAIQKESGKIHLALNKPPGYICTSRDPQNRPLALDLLPRGFRLYSVGRLDFMSCGLIFFTNDGDFASRLGHPSNEIEKEYIVHASGFIPDTAIEAFNRGITIEDERYMAKEAERIGRNGIRICLVEGKNREIRKVFSYFHLHPVLIKRIRIGSVMLGDLAEGNHRPLSEKELEDLNGNRY